MAQDRRYKFGGARYNKPHEVHDKLEALGRTYNGFYDNIMRRAIIRWDLDIDEVWVEGRFRATSRQMIRWTGATRSSFYIKWRKIVETGLIREEEDGVWVVTMIIRKEDVAVSDAEVKRMQQQQLEMSEEFREMKGNFQRVTAILEEWKTEKGHSDSSKSQDVITSHESGQPDKSGSFPDKSGSFPDSTSLLRFKKEVISLSEVNKLISAFYRVIGIKQIPKQVRDKAKASFKSLLEDGYLPGQIAYALDWIPKNATEPVKHFGIVPHMIDQALDAGKKEVEIQEAKKAIQQEREEKQRDRLSEQQEVDALKNYKAQLSDEKRAELRENALEKLRNTPGMNADFISEPLVAVMENDIIREEGVDLAAFRPDAEEKQV